MAWESSFKASDGTMYCEEISLTAILEQTEKRYKTLITPLFVYSKKQLHENVQAYLDTLRQFNCPYQLNFSIKANQNLTVLREFQSLGTSATLVSGNELKLALEAGFEPTHLMFNGVGKCAWETQLAVKYDVLINVDSEWDLRQTMDICRHGFPEQKRARVLLRMNLDIDPQVHKYVTTGMNNDCKFGMSEEAAESCIKLLEEPDCPAELVGLHSHMGSTIYRTDVFKLCTERLLDIRQRLKDRGFTNLHILNVGGGLGIDYLQREPETRPWRRELESNQKDIMVVQQFLLLKVEAQDILPEAKTPEMAQTSEEFDWIQISTALTKMLQAITNYKEEKISLADLREDLKTLLSVCPELRQDIDRLCPYLTKIRPDHVSPQDLVQSVSGLLKDKDITLILEPGRSLVANSCVLLARVLGCKQTANKRYAITDASMAEIIRPCLYGSYHHVTALGAKPGGVKHVYDVVGPVCESADFIGKDRILPDPEDGLLVVHDVGAYCYSMSSNYNVRMKAAEVLVDGSKWSLIRRQDTFEDFMAPYKNLD